MYTVFFRRTAKITAKCFWKVWMSFKAVVNFNIIQYGQRSQRIIFVRRNKNQNFVIDENPASMRGKEGLLTKLMKWNIKYIEVENRQNAFIEFVNHFSTKNPLCIFGSIDLFEMDFLNKQYSIWQFYYIRSIYVC